MTDPLQRLEALREESSSKKGMLDDPWKPLLVLLALPVLLVVVGRLLIGWDAPNEKRIENALEYCNPAPTKECQERVLAADQKCVEERSNVHSTRSNGSSFYFGCMNSRLPRFTDKVDSPSATPGLDLSPGTRRRE